MESCTRTPHRIGDNGFAVHDTDTDSGRHASTLLAVDQALRIAAGFGLARFCAQGWVGGTDRSMISAARWAASLCQQMTCARAFSTGRPSALGLRVSGGHDAGLLFRSGHVQHRLGRETFRVHWVPRLMLLVAQGAVSCARRAECLL